MKREINCESECPKCHSSMEWMPSDCDHSWHNRIRVSASFDVLKSFDAQEWAATFMAILQANPQIVIDREFMVTWFANALMRGYDEHYWRTAEYKRKVSRALYPWWHWKRWILA